MHIPDNYLSPSTCAVLGTAMIPIWRRAVSKVKKEMSPKKMPMMGVAAAFSFLIMMLNIPLPGGTTGHAIGGTLIAILIGPYAACISITIALLMQAFLFGDGGILAFGANAFNMAFIIPFAGYYIYRLIKRIVGHDKGEYTAAFAAAYIAINIAALFAGIELGIQPLLFRDSAGMPLYCPYALSISIPAMILPHLLVAGIAEGIVTAGVYCFIKKISPDQIYGDSKIKIKAVYPVVISLIILAPLGLLASGSAWGEWDNEQIANLVGYVPKGMQTGFEFKALMGGYSMRGIPNFIAYITCAMAGAAILIIFFKLLSARRGQYGGE